MAVAYTGRQGLLLENVRDLIAQSAQWQTTTGAANAAAAEAFIQLVEKEYASGDRPFCSVWFGSEWSWTRNSLRS